jgi:hypothetical protein
MINFLNWGLESSQRRVFFLYLPLTMWVFCLSVPILSYLLFGSFLSIEVERYLKVAFVFLSAIYGIGFVAYFLLDPKSKRHQMFVGVFLLLGLIAGIIDLLH